jgi:hypothetical protein
MADVRLADHRVYVDAADLMLSHPERTSVPADDPGRIPGPRRALVHDFDDALALNYAGDYPGGVRIFGRVSVDYLELTQGVLLEHPPTWPLAPADIQRLVMPASELAQIRELRDEVATLASRVRSLEARVGP